MAWTQIKTQTGFVPKLGEKDEASWARFKEMYGPHIRGILGNRVSDDDLQDAEQEFYLGMLNWLPKQRDNIRCFRAWLLVVLVRFANGWHRRKSYQGEGKGGTNAVEEVNWIARPVDDKVETTISRTIERLSGRQKMILESLLNGDSQKDIAKTLGVTAAFVNQQIHRQIFPVIWDEFNDQ